VWVRRGWRGLELSFPHLVGADAAGVVESLGPPLEDGASKRDAAAPQLKIGDEVVLSAGWSCGECPRCRAGQENLCGSYHLFGEHRPGCAAERFCAPARNLLPKPAGLSFEEAAAVGVSTLTAYHMLTARAALQPGERLLVHGASSGVGAAAIAMGRQLGARIAAISAGAEKLQRARELGAELVLDRSNTSAQALREQLRAFAPEGFDVVFEHTGELTWPLSVKALRLGGRLVSCGATTGYRGEIDLRLLFAKQLSLLGSTMGTRRELIECLRLAERGVLKPQIDSVLPLSEIHEGYARLEEGRHFGKVVLRP